MAEFVWKIKLRGSPGWVRERHGGQPVMTGVVFEAEQFATQAEADAAVAGFGPKVLPMVVVRSARHSVDVHGDEAGGFMPAPAKRSRQMVRSKTFRW